MNANPSVDSFFLMSSTLTSYIMARQLEAAGTDVIRLEVLLDLSLLLESKTVLHTCLAAFYPAHELRTEPNLPMWQVWHI